MSVKEEDANVSMGRYTEGTFFIHIESESGLIEVEMFPENYAKASIGMIVKAKLRNTEFTGQEEDS